MSAYIYKIEPTCEHGDGDVYIGSTIQRDRFSKHKHRYKYRQNNSMDYSSFILFDKYGVDNCQYTIIEECPIDNRYEREGWWIENTNCVNMRPAPSGKTLAHDYYIKYRQDHKDELAEKAKAWRDSNREECLIKYKERYARNKEKMLAQQAELFVCGCGSQLRKGNRAEHFRSKKHTDWEANKSE
jgi:hypothetical protein